MNSVTMKLQADPLILQALQEDITGEDVTTNAILPEDCQGEAELLCKQDGIIAGLDVFARPFTLLDDKVWFEFFVKDGDEVWRILTTVLAVRVRLALALVRLVLLALSDHPLPMAPCRRVSRNSSR